MKKLKKMKTTAKGKAEGDGGKDLQLGFERSRGSAHSLQEFNQRKSSSLMTTHKNALMDDIIYDHFRHMPR